MAEQLGFTSGEGRKKRVTEEDKGILFQFFNSQYKIRGKAYYPVKADLIWFPGNSLSQITRLFKLWCKKEKIKPTYNIKVRVKRVSLLARVKRWLKR